MGSRRALVISQSKRKRESCLTHKKIISKLKEKRINDHVSLITVVGFVRYSF